MFAARAERALGQQEVITDRRVTESDLPFNKVSLAIVLTLEETRETPAVTQSSLGQGPAVGWGEERSGSGNTLKSSVWDLRTPWMHSVIEERKE